MSDPAKPPPGWRVVEPGERIEASDVTQDWITRRLMPVPDWCVGMFRLERWKPCVSVGW